MSTLYNNHTKHSVPCHRLLILICDLIFSKNYRLDRLYLIGLNKYASKENVLEQICGMLNIKNICITFLADGLENKRIRVRILPATKSPKKKVHYVKACRNCLMYDIVQWQPYSHLQIFLS